MNEKEMELYYQDLEEELVEYDSRVSEMAKEIFNTCAWRFSNPNDYKGLFRDIAEELVKLNYCKIPEGSVVLDRHEHQKYCAYKIIEPQIKGCLDRERELEKQVSELEEQRDRQAYIAEELIQEKHRWTEQTRKETAKEILSLATKHDNGYETDMTRFICDLKKQYGVEE